MQKKCGKCQIIKDISNFHKNCTTKDGFQRICKNCDRLKLKNYRKNNLEKVKKYQRKYAKKWRIRNKEIYSVKMKKYRLDNKERLNKQQRNRQQKLRINILKHYGGKNPKCACCGETELKFLSLDHINNDGAKHRKMMGNGKYSASGSMLNYWIKRNNYPLGFQVLCFNCNLSKGIYGKCPHKK